MLGGNQSVGTLSVAYLPTQPKDHRFEVMHPGATHNWKPLPKAAAHLADTGSAARLTVPLERGCALVRLVDLKTTRYGQHTGITASH